MNDNKIQEMLDKKTLEEIRQLTQPEQEDYKIYDNLVNILNHQPQPIVPYYFSKKVVNKIQQKEDRKNAIAIYALVGLLFSITAYFVSHIVTTDVIKQIGSNALNNCWIFIFGLISFLLIQLADTKLIVNKKAPIQ